jgi:pimeloyl-ACP methyl ester carboxylesterase
MTLRIVGEVREDGTTIRLIGHLRAEHLAPVREEIAASHAPTALDLDEVTLADLDAVRFLVTVEHAGITLQHCAPFIREWMTRERGAMPTKPSIVCCHGIWADGSSFSKVIPPLQAEGYEVMAAQYGLDTLEGDVATVKRTLGRVSSPAILVGHSYGGSVITAAGTDERVAGLVYIAALANDANETSQSQQEKFPVTDIFKYVEVADGRLWMKPEGVACFAGDLSAEEQKVVWATHSAPAADLFSRNAPGVAWKSKPSWYIVANNDRTVHPDLERFLAKRMRATTRAIDSSHVPMLSQPSVVVDVIRAAAQAVREASATV